MHKYIFIALIAAISSAWAGSSQAEEARRVEIRDAAGRIIAVVNLADPGTSGWRQVDDLLIVQIDSMETRDIRECSVHLADGAEIEIGDLVAESVSIFVDNQSKLSIGNLTATSVVTNVSGYGRVDMAAGQAAALASSSFQALSE